jgi:hypothetical protein
MRSAISQLLLYATAGAAWGDWSTSSSLVSLPSTWLQDRRPRGALLALERP